MKKSRILLLYKKSSYESFHRSLHSIEIRRFEQTHKNHYASLEKIESVLKSKGVDYDRFYRGQKINFNKYNFVITVGGDGTLLDASHSIIHQTVLGVNSDPIWSVGRFCAANASTFESYFDHYLSGNAHIVLMPRISILVNDHLTNNLILNDVLICHENPAAMSRYYIQYKHIKEEQRSSGLWISTAAGSTGAIRSAGGKIIPADSKEFQYKVRELYQGFKGKSYLLKEGILKPSEKITIISRMRDGCLYLDGAHIRLKFPIGEKVTFKPSKFPLKIIRK